MPITRSRTWASVRGRRVSPEGHMAKSNASTVQEYLDELPDDRRPVVETVRKAILKSLPKGYREAMNWGVINYEVPLERFPDTHNGHPLTGPDKTPGTWGNVQLNGGFVRACYLRCARRSEELLRTLPDERLWRSEAAG